MSSQNLSLTPRIAVDTICCIENFRGVVMAFRFMICYLIKAIEFE